MCSSVIRTLTQPPWSAARIARCLCEPPAKPTRREIARSSAAPMPRTRSSIVVSTRSPVGVEEAQAHVANCTGSAQRLLIACRHRVARLAQQLGRLQAADASEQHRQRRPERGDVANVGVGHQRPAARHRRHDARRREQRRTDTREPAELLGKVCCLGLDRGQPDATKHLHDRFDGPDRPRRHRIDSGQHRRGPRRDADAVSGAERRLDVDRARRTDRRRHIVGVDRGGDDDVRQPIPVAHRHLEIGVHARRRHDRGTHDAQFHGLLEDPAHSRLGDVERRGDLGLSEPLLVIQQGDLGDQGQTLERRRSHLRTASAHGLVATYEAKSAWRTSR